MVNATIDLQKGRDYITTGVKSMKMADMRQWGVGHWIVVGILCLALILLFARFRESPMFTGSKTTPLVTETAQAPAPDPEARLSAMEKTQAEILAILKQGAPKEPPATTPQGGNALPPTGQEGYGQQGDPRAQQQPQGGYGAGRPDKNGLSGAEQEQLEGLLGKKAGAMLGPARAGHLGYSGVFEQRQEKPAGCKERRVADRETGYWHVRVTCPPASGQQNRH